MRKIGLKLVCATIVYLSGFYSTTAQTLESCDGLLDQIGDFEGRRDPKCAATANRLEDFMYGTPLEETARIKKANLQKELILKIWKAADSLDRMLGLKEVSILTLKQVTEKRIPIVETEKQFQFNVGETAEYVTKRDFLHYSAVAYAYRAILSVQQDALFNAELSLLPLSSAAAKELKEYMDKVTLMVLKIADRQSRKANELSVSPKMFETAWHRIVGSIEDNLTLKSVVKVQRPEIQLALVKAIVQKKKEAFENYNHISMFLFQRNAQVYFSRHGWPKDEKENERFRAAYNETLIQFVKDMWLKAEKLASKEESPLIRLEHISEALDLFLPYKANQLEDITFFPRLARDKQIDVEAYDLDAFRDGGVHWTYIEMALGDSGFSPVLMPDPFALELLSEGIAHMGVLTLRVAGNKSKELGHERMDRSDFIEGLKYLQSLILESGNANENLAKQQIVSSEKKNKAIPEGQLFTEVTSNSGVDFEHRSADWLSRFIRSYRVDSSENLVKTTIPPAFGGGGVAAEDINNDGFPDILLLSGLGNKLYLNKGDGTFSDVTISAGLIWNRKEDKLPGEPRQPIIADFDNDGLQDIFISYVNDDHRIYRNLGGAKFEDMTMEASFGGHGSVGGPSTAIDFDGDGLLDIYIGYFGDYLNAIHPTLARRNRNGLANQLFRNLGNFNFEKIEGAGIEDFGWSQSIGHADINGDNLQDLICGNDFGTNSYYINNGDGTFTDKSHELGTDKPSFTMNVGVTDLNRDHRPDFYISNIVVMEKDEKYVNPTANSPMRFNAESVVNMRVVEANDLFISGKSDAGTDYSLSTDISRGYSSTGWSWDADFFDYDNDGDQDLYCLTGMNDFLVYSTENPYFEDKEGIGKKVFFAESHRESNVFFENQNGKLVSGNEKSGLEVVYNSRSAAFLDLDMDGDEDIVMNNYHDKANVFENIADSKGNNWIKIRLVGKPEKGITKDAIGAKVIVTASDLDVWREIHSTTGYLSVHPKEQHIGVGGNKAVEVQVIWPDGTDQKFENVEANGRYILEYSKDLKQ